MYLMSKLLPSSISVMFLIYVLRRQRQFEAVLMSLRSYAILSYAVGKPNTHPKGS